MGVNRFGFFVVVFPGRLGFNRSMKDPRSPSKPPKSKSKSNSKSKSRSRETTTPLSPYAATPVATEGLPANLNPLSAKGHLPYLSFLATVGILSFLNYFVSENLQTRLLVAKSTLDSKRIMTAFAIWAVISAAGFFMITNSFIKRWASILGRESLTFTQRGLIRLGLLSPLLSVYLLGVTLLFSRRGPLREPVPGLTVMAVLVTLLIPFHAGLLMWRKHEGEIRILPGLHFALTDQNASPSESVRRVLPDVKSAAADVFPINAWGELVYIHVFPYFSPVTKYGYSLFADYRRASLLAEATSDDHSALCKAGAEYIDVQVKDCFMTHYARMAAICPFSSPVPGFYFETKYRQRINREEAELSPGDRQGVSRTAIYQVAMALLALQNPLSLVEEGNGVRDRREFLRPIGFLRYFGSPEIPGIEFGQDLQRRYLAERIVPAVGEQLARVEQALSGAGPAFTQGDRWKIRREIEGLKGRLATLRSESLLSQ